MSEMSENVTPAESTYDSAQVSKVSKVSTVPDKYLSVRVTCPHIDMKRMLCKIFDGYEYICYPHKGQKTKKEHVHVLVPGDSAAVKSSIKQRLQRQGYKGNESYSIKGMHNGLDKGIQYASKEGTDPVCFGDFEDIIKSAPAWVETRMHDHFSLDKDIDPKKIRDWQLCYSNCIGVMVHHAKKNAKTYLSFDDCFRDLCNTTNWKPNIQMQQKGISPFMRSDYEVRLGKRKERDFEFLHKWNA